MLPWGFAKTHGLIAKSRDTEERVVDATGNMVGLLRVFDVSIQFAGETSTDTLDFFINPSLGTEGILAPQDLVRSGWALIIDLGREELRYEPAEAALKRIARGSSSPLHPRLRFGFFVGGLRCAASIIHLSSIYQTGHHRRTSLIRPRTARIAGHCDSLSSRGVLSDLWS